jgi:hypothetical protein
MASPAKRLFRHSDSLTEYKATVDYLWDKTCGFAAQCFSPRRMSDALAYASSQTGSPNSNGFILQANYLPLNKGTGPSFWPRSNVEFSLQYVVYNRFDDERRRRWPDREGQQHPQSRGVGRLLTRFLRSPDFQSSRP